MMINSRTRENSSGCPSCAKIQRVSSFRKTVVASSGSLAITFPELASEWHPTKNNGLTPFDLTAGSSKKIWWKCHVCTYEWEASPNNRKKGSGCPCCSGRVPMPGVNDLATINPILAQEWNYKKNKGVTPNMVLPKSGKKVWWLCSICKHEWEEIIINRTNGRCCPNCRHHQK